VQSFLNHDNKHADPIKDNEFLDLVTVSFSRSNLARRDS
jgi:hypothetical protein